MDARLTDLLRTIDLVVLGRRLRAERISAGLTQGALASTDITVSYVSRIEAGQRRPDGKVLERLAERLQISPEALLDGRSEADESRLRLNVAFVELALETGDAGEALRRAAPILAADRDTPSPHIARVRLLKARALEVTGQVEDAIKELEELLADDPQGLHALRIGIALSRCYREIGDLTRAITSGERLLARVDALDLSGRDEAVQLTVTVAAAYFEQGDTHTAVRMCQDAVSVAESTGSALGRASAYWNASMMELERGTVGAAVNLAERALAILGEGQDERNLGRLRSQLGIMQLQLDPPALVDAAENLHAAALGLASSSASRIDVVRNDVALARAQFLSGDASGARQAAANGYAAVLDAAPLLAADARALEGQAAAAEGDMDAARALFHEAVLILTSVGADRSAAQLWLDLGNLLASVGEDVAARDAYLSAAVSTGLRARQSGRLVGSE